MATTTDIKKADVLAVEVPATKAMQFRKRLTAADLPPLMTVSTTVDPDPYRYPVLQFVADWNHATDSAALIAAAPSYDGDDRVLLPAIAALAHGLAERDNVPVPDWVFAHRSSVDVVMFGGDSGGWYGPWVRPRAPAACSYHRVWFHHRLLDKGTADWWLPWD